MQEQYTQSDIFPALLPGPVQCQTALTENANSTPPPSEVLRFLSLAICDGRYVRELASDPRGVADKLGFPLSSEAEEDLHKRPLEEHLLELHAGNFQAFAGLVIVVVAAIIIIIAIAISRYSREKDTRAMVRDLSPQANLKL